MTARILLIKQKGATLIEALIGILIFSFGILALVGMQASAISFTTDAKYRVDAAFYANEIVGRIWIDQANIANYAYSGGTAPAQMQDWVQRVGQGLPGGAATVAVAGQTVTVTILWTPPNATQRNHQALAYIAGIS